MSDLFNKVLGALSVPQRSFVQRVKSKEGEFYERRLRKELIGATKIRLSNEFIENAVALSFSYPKYLNQIIPQAIPCLDTIWIEWDENFRFSCVEKQMIAHDVSIHDHKDGVSDEVGYLIEKSDIGHVYSLFMEIEGKLASPPLSMIFSNDPDEPITTEHTNKRRELSGYSPVSIDVDIENRSNAIHHMFGKTYNHIHWDEAVGTEDQPIKELMRWCFNCQVGTHDLAVSMYGDAIANEDSQLAEFSLKTMDGDMRFLIAVFALLNYPRILRERWSPKPVPRIQWGKRLPRNEVKVIELDLPKKNGVNIYKQLFTGHGTPKRQHVRRGHWRVLKDPNGRITDRKWIKPMIVGNPELGIIEHEFLLKSKGARK